MKRTALLLLLGVLAVAPTVLARSRPGACAVSPHFEFNGPFGPAILHNLYYEETAAPSTVYGTPSVHVRGRTIEVVQPVLVSSVAIDPPGSTVCHFDFVDLGALDVGEWIVAFREIVQDVEPVTRSYTYSFSIPGPPPCTPLTAVPGVPDSSEPFVISNSYSSYYQGLPVARVSSGEIVVTEPIYVGDIPPPPYTPPCIRRTVTVGPLLQGSYHVRWQQRDERGNVAPRGEMTLTVAGPSATGASHATDCGTAARVGPAVVVTGAGPGLLHIHYENHFDDVLSMAPQFVAQFIGSRLRVTQAGTRGPGGAPLCQVEDFDIPLPPSGDYTLDWSYGGWTARGAFTVEPSLPPSRCGGDAPAFVVGGNRLQLFDFFTGSAPSFGVPVLTVSGQEIRVQQLVSDPSLSAGSDTGPVTRCHSASVELPPLASGRYRVLWTYTAGPASGGSTIQTDRGAIDIGGRHRRAGR